MSNRIPGLTSDNRSLVRRSLAGQLLCVLLSLAVLVYPIYVIWPFRHQGPRELAAALMVVRFRPWLDVVLAAVSVSLLLFAWRKMGSIGSRVAAAGCAVLVITFGGLSRVNLYELMFHPLDRPTFSTADKAKLNGDEEVIAVRVRREARAYPVRSMSYHHIVNDVLGGLPIVATY